MPFYNLYFVCFENHIFYFKYIDDNLNGVHWIIRFVSGFNCKLLLVKLVSTLNLLQCFIVPVLTVHEYRSCKKKRQGE